jgi:hypothetical protein
MWIIDDIMRGREKGRIKIAWQLTVRFCDTRRRVAVGFTVLSSFWIPFGPYAAMVDEKHKQMSVEN